MDEDKEPEKIYVSWEKVHEMCKTIVERLNELPFVPDVIITPLRGGAIPAVIIAYLLEMRNIIAVNAERTEDDSVNAENKDLVLERLPTKEQIENKNILFIDEIVDSAETWTKIHAYLSSLSPKKIVSATLYSATHQRQANSPAIDISIKDADKWVVFPWE